MNRVPSLHRYSENVVRAPSEEETYLGRWESPRSITGFLRWRYHRIQMVNLAQHRGVVFRHRQGVLRLGGRFGAVKCRSLRIVVRVSVKYISQRYRLRLVSLWCRANSWWWAVLEVFCPVRALSIRLNRWQCTKSQ